MKIHSILLVLALSGVSGAAIAQWQWLDKDGRKVFSDLAPPPDVQEKDILKRPNTVPKPATPSVSTSKDAINAQEDAPAPAPLVVRNTNATSPLDKEIEAKKKQATEADAAKRKAEDERMAKTKAENCARARQAKLTYDSGVRISRTNASGEREFLDDVSRAADLKQIQGIIESECK